MHQLLWFPLHDVFDLILHTDTHPPTADPAAPAGPALRLHPHEDRPALSTVDRRPGRTTTALPAAFADQPPHPGPPADRLLPLDRPTLDDRAPTGTLTDLLRVGAAAGRPWLRLSLHTGHVAVGLRWQRFEPRTDRPEPGLSRYPSCACPTRCDDCQQPPGDPHNPDCDRRTGSPAHTQPVIPAAPAVTFDHCHGPGCPYVTRRPGPLFTRDGPEGVRCLMCGRCDTLDADSFGSFGGTTEGWQHCTACHHHWSWLDISAVR